MSTNKRPRKAYRPRPKAYDNMAIALRLAAKPAPADRAEIMGMLASALKALREGVATELQWSVAAGSVSVARAIERLGVVRGLQEHLDSAEQHLQAIYNRAKRAGDGRWLRPTLYYQELDALQLFHELHTFQVDQLSRAEFIAALDAAEIDAKNQGHVLTMATDFESLAA